MVGKVILLCSPLLGIVKGGSQGSGGGDQASGGHGWLNGRSCRCRSTNRPGRRTLIPPLWSSGDIHLSILIVQSGLGMTERKSSWLLPLLKAKQTEINHITSQLFSKPATTNEEDVRNFVNRYHHTTMCEYHRLFP